MKSDKNEDFEILQKEIYAASGLIENALRSNIRSSWSAYKKGQAVLKSDLSIRTRNQHLASNDTVNK